MLAVKGYWRILSFVGIVLAVLGVSMLVPMLLGIVDGDSHAAVFGVTGFAGILGGVLLRRGIKVSGELDTRDAYLLVTMSWVVAGVYGAVPFMAYGTVPSFPMAFFETVSGFTTTGASVITDVEALPRSLLLWRSMTHWLGGLGIVALFISLLSFFGNSGLQMYKAEVTGPIKEKLVPRVKETAKILWKTYMVMTAIQIAGMTLAGMPLFDAVCHAFGTVATGGFGIKNDSLAGYSEAAQAVTAFFMMASSINLSLFYVAFKQRSFRQFFKNEELRVYLAIVFASSLISTWALVAQSGEPFGTALLDSLFQIISVMTSTGFVTKDYTFWPAICQFLILWIPFIGSCAGSTGGGVKVGRFMILYKSVRVSFLRILHPRAVINLRVNEKVITPDILVTTQIFFFMYMGITIAAAGILCMAGYDVPTSFSAVATCINNVGPGFGLVGPIDNFSALPAWSLYMFSFLMLLGRLEMYTVLLLFSRSFWREA